ncbi:hypothetical protein IEQ34_025548 [Dendrobium chrysotoxum]|uniref:Major facilitator superfamily (MFS) profile domain-containing protein n=1 Tax=Dendrobium chrysotoxum TaxID=161865 RepID=A0AAV7FPG8_DENCH|nr:hypothetical protein IEQ34_025548 [Dendrobium chrysotoxum]
MNLHYLYGGRFVAGLGAGILTMIVPPLPGGTGSSRYPRSDQCLGAIHAWPWLFYGGVGDLRTFIHLKSSSGQWRIPLGLQNLPTLFLATLIWVFPESPR